MTTAAMQRDDLMPRAPKGMGKGLALAAVVHVGLLIALTFGVSWRASEPEGIEAELWAAVPQIAAQRANDPEPPRPTPPKPEPKPEPAPPPKAALPDPQIAIEKARQEKLKEAKKHEEEQDKLEKKKAQEDKLKADKAEADKRKKEEARKDELLAAQREANIKKILGDAGATGAAPGGKAATTAGASAGYAGRIKARIKPNILLTDSIDGNPEAVVVVRLAPDGTILSSKLTKSSGIKAWDDAVLRAIDKTEILPRDTDGTIPSSMELAFKPRDF